MSRVRRLAGWIAAAACVCAAPLPASAAQPDDVKGVQVGKFQLQGVPEDLGKPLRRGLVLSGESGFLSTKYPVFYPSLLDADLNRVRLFLARNGYPYAAVTPELETVEQKLQVTFAVRPGPAVVVDSVAFLGIGEDARRRAAKASPLRPGGVFRQDDFDRTRTVLQQKLGEMGYAAAAVQASVAAGDSTRVVVTYDIDPGNIHYFGRLRISGVPDDLVGLAHKSLAIDPGDRYNARDVTQARDDLRLLGLFRQVRVETTPGGPDTLDVVAQLSERDPRTVELGAGYWTDDGIRGHARWIHRNLFRGGRGLEVKGSVSQYLVDADASTWWPALLGPRTRVTLTLQGAFQDEDAYEQVTAGAETSLSYRLSVRSWVRGGIQVSSNTVESKTDDPVFLEDEGVITSLLGSLQRDTSDDLLYPTRGSVTEFGAEWSPPGVWTDIAFARAWARRSDYLPLTRRTVFATKVGLGLAEPLGGSLDLIADRRFFSGGANSNRGFERNRLGPKDTEGNPIGGAARLDLSGELRFPLFSIFEAALFVDVGQVWSTVGAMRPADLETGLGPAIMFRTPVGPVRADFGFRASTVDTDEPELVIHLLIGNPY